MRGSYSDGLIRLSPHSFIQPLAITLMLISPVRMLTDGTRCWSRRECSNLEDTKIITNTQLQQLWTMLKMPSAGSSPEKR